MTLFKFKVQKSLGVMAGWTLVSRLAVLTYELAIVAAAGAGDAENFAEHVLYPLVIRHQN